MPVGRNIKWSGIGRVCPFLCLHYTHISPLKSYPIVSLLYDHGITLAGMFMFVD